VVVGVVAVVVGVVVVVEVVVVVVGFSVFVELGCRCGAGGSGSIFLPF